MSGCVCCVWNFIRCSCKSCLAVCVVFEIYVVPVRVFVFYYKLYVVYVKCVFFFKIFVFLSDIVLCYILYIYVTTVARRKPYKTNGFRGGGALCYNLYIYVTTVYLLNALYILLNLAVLILFVCFNCFTLFFIFLYFVLLLMCTIASYNVVDC